MELKRFPVTCPIKLAWGPVTGTLAMVFENLTGSTPIKRPLQVCARFSTAGLVILLRRGINTQTHYSQRADQTSLLGFIGAEYTPVPMPPQILEIVC